MRTIQTLLNELKEAEKKYHENQRLLELRRGRLYAFTDWKSQGISNKEGRDGYVATKLEEKKEGYPTPGEVLVFKNDYNRLLREYALIEQGIAPELVWLVYHEIKTENAEAKAK